MSKYKCEICSKEFEKVGSYNLHKYHCENKQLRVATGKAEKVSAPGDTKKCSHSWSLLGGKTTQERTAMQYGYKKHCEKCGELE